MECPREIEMDDFAATMQRFESHFTAGLITTTHPVEYTPADDLSLLLAKNPEFDQFPVRTNGEITGVLERHKGASTNAQDYGEIRPLSAELLIPSDVPIPALVKAMVSRSYFLVLCGPARFGLVTRSDLLKLPVRLHAFTLITHLEQVMSRAITHKFKNEREWLVHLNTAGRNEVLHRYEELHEEGLDPNLIQLTQFGHKITIVTEACHLNERSVHELNDLEELRNQVMHGRDYAENETQLKTFNTRLQCARDWIDRINDYLAGREFVQPEMKSKHGSTEADKRS